MKQWITIILLALTTSWVSAQGFGGLMQGKYREDVATKIRFSGIDFQNTGNGGGTVSVSGSPTISPVGANPLYIFNGSSYIMVSGFSGWVTGTGARTISYRLYVQNVADFIGIFSQSPAVNSTYGNLWAFTGLWNPGPGNRDHGYISTWNSSDHEGYYAGNVYVYGAILERSYAFPEGGSFSDVKLYTNGVLTAWDASEPSLDTAASSSFMLGGTDIQALGGPIYYFTGGIGNFKYSSREWAANETKRESLLMGIRNWR